MSNCDSFLCTRLSCLMSHRCLVSKLSGSFLGVGSCFGSFLQPLKEQKNSLYSTSRGAQVSLKIQYLFKISLARGQIVKRGVPPCFPFFFFFLPRMRPGAKNNPRQKISEKAPPLHPQVMRLDWPGGLGTDSVLRPRRE